MKLYHTWRGYTTWIGLTVLLVLVMSSNTIAENGGGITVYVLDQNGDTIDHLVDITVVDGSEDVIANAQLQPLQDHIQINNIPHSGTYAVWAYYTEEFVRNRFNCSAQGWEENSSLCYWSIWSYQQDEGGCFALGCGLECSKGALDENGSEIAYKDSYGLYYSCVETHPGYFNKLYRIDSVGFAYTNVKKLDDEKFENDSVRITLDTRGSTWMIAKYIKKNDLYGRKPTKVLLQDKWVEVGKDAFSELVDKYVGNPFFKSLLGKKGGIVSSIVVTTGTALTEPDKLLTEEGKTKVIVDLGTGAVLAYYEVYYDVGAMVSVPVFIAKEVVYIRVAEYKRCAHTGTDDLDVVVNSEPGIWPPMECDTSMAPDCCRSQGSGVAYFSCEPTSKVRLFNYGNTLRDVRIDVKAQDEPCKEALTDPEVFSEGIELYGPDWNTNTFATMRSTDGSSLINDATLVYGSVTLENESLCYNDPYLNSLLTASPIIWRTDYSGAGYPGDNITVSSEIYDDEETIIGDYSFINWTYEDVSHSAAITSSGSNTWQGTIPIPTNAISCDTIVFQVQATDTDDHKTIDDNDKRLYSISVIRDVNTSGDAPDLKAAAFRVYPSSSYKLGWLWPQPGEVFGAEQDWYKIYVEKGKNYTLNVNAEEPLNLRVYNPNGPTEDYPIQDQLYRSINHSGSGFVYLGFMPAEALDYGMNYSFRVTEGGTRWAETWGKSTAYNTTYAEPSTFICGGGENYPCESGMMMMGIEDVSASIHEVNGYDPNDFEPDDTLNLGAHIDQDCNDEDKRYMDVEVAFEPFTGYGGVTVQHIQPVINDEEDQYECDETNIDTYVEDYTLQYFTAHVPIPEEDGEYYIKLKVYYRSTSLPYFTYTEPFGFNFDVRKAPTLNNFSTNVSYNSITLKVDASDDETLKNASFYFNSQHKCTTSFSGHITTCLVNTSTYADNTAYNTYVEVSDTESSYFRSSNLNVVARKDAAKPRILSTSVLPTSQGNVHGNNVSGKVTLSVLAYDTEGGVSSIRWFRDGTSIGSGATLNWTTTTTGDGLHNMRVNISDPFGNTETSTFTVRVDNTPPTIISNTPESYDVLDGIVDLEVNASDTQSGVWDAKWYLGSTKIGSRTKTIWGSGGLNGSYTIKVNVTDAVGNIRNLSIPVTIISPDFAINSSETAITRKNVTATIRNRGSADAYDVNISFYGGEELFASEVINLTAGGSRTLTMNYTTREDYLIVYADPYDWSAEINESNNYAIIENPTAPPRIIIVYPENGSSIPADMDHVLINISTNEPAVCRYHTSNASFNFTSGTLFTATGLMNHIFNYTGLTGNSEYTLYYKCNDTQGNVNPIATYHTFSTTSCVHGGIYTCWGAFCCGTDDGICPTLFDGVACGVPDPDCFGSGISTCLGDFVCGEADGICPTLFDGVTCGTYDPDCAQAEGIDTCQGTFECGVVDGICPEDFDDVSCSTYDIDCN